MKKIIFLFAPLCAMLMVGCIKDEPNVDFLKLYAERYAPGNSAKAAVRDDATYWVDGDRVRINNRFFKVRITNSDGSAAAAEMEEGNSVPTGPISAVYPASAYKSNTGSSYTVTIPNSYDYEESGPSSGNKQILEGLPMVAYSSDEAPESLSFKHLTAAITVQVKYTRTDIVKPLELDRIELINTQYALSGDVTFDITAAENGEPAVSSSELGERDSVVVYFNPYVCKKSVNPGEVVDIQVPIRPVGSTNSQFIIRVVGHIDGARYVFEKEANTRDNTILRAQLGYATTKFETSSTAKDLFDVKKEVTIEVGGEPVTRNFYEINTPEELITLAEALDEGYSTTSNDTSIARNYRTGNYILMKDIDLEGAAIVPIHYYNADGAERVYFYGNNKTISNFVATSALEIEPNCCGLFGKTAGDSITVMDLTVKDAFYDFNHSARFLIYRNENEKDTNYTSAVGGIFAYVDKKGIVIENCHVINVEMGAKNAITNDLSYTGQVDFYTGGIVGLLTEGCTIRNCSVRNVRIDNSADGSDKLVDQFGGAIGRIDVPGKRIYSKKGLEAPRVVIENFTYNQGDTVLEFIPGLRRIRVGGVVSNVTRGCILTLDNCSITHNVKLYKDNNTREIYVGGLIGSNRAGGAGGMGIRLNPNCTVSGIIYNEAIQKYSSNFYIEKYVGYQIDGIDRITNNSPISADTCINNLSIVSSNPSKYKTSFNKADQRFSKIRSNPE